MEQELEREREEFLGIQRMTAKLETLHPFDSGLSVEPIYAVRPYAPVPNN